MNFDELKEKIQKFNDNDSTGKVTLIENKNYRGNQHDLQTFMQRVSFEEYKKKVKKTYVQKNETIYSSADDIQEMLEKSQYKKKWGRLDNYCKKVKIKEYLNNLINNGDLNKDKYDEYFEWCEDKIKKKKLNKKNEIDYNDVEGKINKIFNLLS